VTTSIRLTDGANTVWLRPAAPTSGDQVVCSTHELSFPEPEAVEQPNPDDAGINDQTARWGSGTFRADLTIRDGAMTRHEMVDLLRSMLAPNKRPTLYIQRDGWLTERQATVRGNAWTCVVDRVAALMLKASLQVIVPAGVLEDTTEQVAVIRPTATSSTGRSYPKTYPWAYTPAASGSSTVVTSSGTVETPMQMRLYGGCTDPVVTNVTTGAVFELDNITLTAGQYLDIDMAARTVLLNGDPAQNYYGKVNFTTSTWWRLQPGANTIRVAVATSDASCELDITWRDRWI
jgi:hypothetical protein